MKREHNALRPEKERAAQSWRPFTWADHREAQFAAVATLLPAFWVALTVLAASLPAPRIVFAQADTKSALASSAMTAYVDVFMDGLSLSR